MADFKEKFAARLADAARTGKLALTFCELTQLPAAAVREIKARSFLRTPFDLRPTRHAAAAGAPLAHIHTRA